MFDIFASSFRTATRTDERWEGPDHWREPTDLRSRGERERDAAHQRRWMRDTGIL